MNCQRRFAGRFLGVTSAVALALIFVARSQAENESTSTFDNAKVKAAIDRATEFLKKRQAGDGSFSAKAGPGVTAIVAAGLLKSGRPVQDPVVAKALKYLEGNRHEDGGIYQQGGNHKNYETCLAIIAFQAANGDHHYDKLLADAEKFVKKEQWDEGEGESEDNVYYGGAGYGSSSRPDLSNTSFLLDALHALGRGDDDPAIQKALIFVSRSQNLKSKYNTEAFADKVNDGGFIYTPAEGGLSMAGKTEDGGLRSYGSMTYAGFKSMIYAGVKKDDPRVKAAHEWIQKHYTLDENPGMGIQGLYYYYHTFAKALDAVGDDKFVDAEGKSHDWRAELAEKYIATQNADGSWVNKTPRWMENDPNLVTAYGLLCLSYCQHKSPPIDHVFAPSNTRQVPR
jgi:squalene-hopene/tetraprenyl-beta-curcumene cyclase